MILIDGKKTASDIRNELKEKILKLKEKGKGVPGLVAILVGDDPASKIYVTSKGKACQEIGMKSKTEILPATISQDELLRIIDHYNSNNDFHGILVQLPLPKHIDENQVIERISPEKDVDGFHPVSVGNLVIGKDTFASCTPAGIQELLKRYEIQTEGKHVVVVGRSNIVGKPIANIMLQKQKFANAVVTICHSAASDLAYFTRQADILIAAIGRANFIKDNMVKEGAVVIDVGINRIDAPETTKGYKIVGDVEFETVSQKTSFITPVPGGVGPMTIAMLLSNTFKSFEKKINKNI
ncbi:MAG TPA: bifunctional methylenetetrahydrofolate dehydrogenase/methenyltetrahydrofolate cyclohydrolase FolD [Ignavibacteriaceae bacterium]|nr:bifunctional methylenetetrahydrofolate dehydrogenase/methenyltetrahydrofolate cyclohydrolase FolD [Ignavibacteriaceae bacterium]